MVESLISEHTCWLLLSMDVLRSSGTTKATYGHHLSPTTLPISSIPISTSPMTPSKRQEKIMESTRMGISWATVSFSATFRQGFRGKMRILGLCMSRWRNWPKMQSEPSIAASRRKRKNIVLNFLDWISSLILHSSPVSSKSTPILVWNYPHLYSKDSYLGWWKMHSDYAWIRSSGPRSSVPVPSQSLTISMINHSWKGTNSLSYLTRNMIGTSSGSRSAKRWEESSGDKESKRSTRMREVSSWWTIDFSFFIIPHHKSSYLIISYHSASHHHLLGLLRLLSYLASAFSNMSRPNCFAYPSILLLRFMSICRL